MRAVQVTRFGGPEVLEVRQVPDVRAGQGQVVVRVAVADVLFLDTQLRSGWGGEHFPLHPPYVPGGGVAGTVLSVGPDVPEDLVGRRVVTMTDGGGYAERVLADAAGLVDVPDELSLPDAAALLQTGPAALSLVEAAALEPGEWVLVTAAGGGLGLLLVQLARAAGARVVAAAGGARKLDAAGQLGAELTVDYTEPDWTARVSAATGGPRVVFDGVGGDLGAAAFSLAARGGRMFAYGVPSGGFAEIDAGEAQRREITVTGIEQVQFAPADGTRLAGQVLRAAAQGRVTPVIGRTFPLERAAEAHAAIESREVVGRTLLLA
ncbi:zinc-binding dehydrogenase [Amycolatopsis aidingensis]|uniref:zinc-binding dehydrogenase n=1 Tax=Amycolatopsis aidingensis TaxID=2842453 RepID=UPI001C0D7A29|nr:zinc-binding dehydrogenase [Amycolatopsis aidingensis]